jgi:hypothetical protein
MQLERTYVSSTVRNSRSLRQVSLLFSLAVARIFSPPVGCAPVLKTRSYILLLEQGKEI